MKKLFFLFAFMGLFAFAANAQKACCASKKGESVSTSVLEKAADSDESIVKQVSNDGEVTYVRKNVCPTSGKVSFTDVEYCTKSSKFVNVSPSDNEKECTKTATATKVSSKDKKSCCAKGSKSSCDKDKKASATKVNMVEEGQ